MGISEESVNLNFKWHKSKRTKIFLITCLVLVFPLIRFNFNTEYIGYFAGECSGVCNANYTITSDEIIIDNFSNIDGRKTHTVLTGNFDDLKFNAPLLLLTNITRIFGCPDCNDGGGYILGFNFGGVSFKFTFDRESSPWYFSNATDIIDERLKKIHDIEASQSNP